MAKKEISDIEVENAAKKPASKAKEKSPKVPKKEELPVEIKGAIETFSTLDMDFEKELFPNCRVKYTVKPKQTLWDKANKQAIKTISKEVSIPGFRKGKAPANIILQKHRVQIEKQTETELANVCFGECQKIAKTPILHNHNNISFHIEGKESNDPTYVFNFESEPAIPKIQHELFKLKTIDTPAVDEKKVQEEIDHVRGFYANWEQIEDRAVELGDFITLDIDDMDTDTPTQVFNGARFEVTEEKMAPWMRDLVIGKNKGEESIGVSKPDATATEEDQKNFKEKKVRITIISIEKSNLPAIDEDLAKKVGAKSLDDMKAKLKFLIESKEQRARMNELRLDIEQQMIHQIIFEIPGTLLEKEANHRMTQLFNNANFKKKWENELTDEQKEEKKNEVKEKSTQALRLFYLSRDIVNTNKISVGESDMAESFDSILDMIYGDQNKLQYKSMPEEEKQMALTQVMMHKAQDHVIHEIEKAQA